MNAKNTNNGLSTLRILKILTAKRLLIGISVLVGAIILSLVVQFSSWKESIVVERNSFPEREVIETLYGPIEFAKVGEGIPILIIHGTPGGYDQSLYRTNSPDAQLENTMTIAVSRPGYRGTPQASGYTFEEQADLLAALLDELDIDKVIVTAGSGGGYVGVQFALRHPNKTMGLILSSAEFRHEPSPLTGTGEIPVPSRAQVFLTEFAMWLAGDAMAPILMPNFDTEDSVQMAMWGIIQKGSIPFGARASGRLNDIKQRLNPAINDWPLHQISSPTLLLHGNADDQSDIENSKIAAEVIPNSELVVFENGDHFLPITKWKEFTREVEEFIRDVNLR